MGKYRTKDQTRLLHIKLAREHQLEKDGVFLAPCARCVKPFHVRPGTNQVLFCAKCKPLYDGYLKFIKTPARIC